jgi:hypothetical protein
MLPIEGFYSTSLLKIFCYISLSSFLSRNCLNNSDCQHLECSHSQMPLLHLGEPTTQVAWDAPGLVWKTGAGAAPGGAYTTETWAVHEWFPLEDPGLRLGVSGQQQPACAAFGFNYIHYRVLSCTWTCLHFRCWASTVDYIETSSFSCQQCCRPGMFIPDFRSLFFPSRIRIFFLSRILDPHQRIWVF